jgi:molybdopterin-containing oxidoreductase family iron-sulfur binding subunit
VSRAIIDPHEEECITMKEPRLHSTEPASHDSDSSSFDRREFLRLAGFTFAGVALAGCEQARVEKAIPYLIKPEEITPGKAYWYASTCAGCNAGCGILIKNRDGRPIKVEGNPDHPVSRGGLCAVGQAQVLGLYDSQRLSGPMMNGTPSDWKTMDRELNNQLSEIRKGNKAVRFLSGSLTSPTTLALIGRFVSSFRNSKHVVYDPISRSGILEAHKRTHGVRVLPRYRFDRADVIVGIEADFLGTWISPVEFTAGYRSGRTLEGSPPRCSYHVQIESRLSLTGGKADKRHAIAPSERIPLLMMLLSLLEGKTISADSSGPSHTQFLNELAGRLLSSKGKSLVVCGSNDVASQILTNAINELLGNYGKTIDIQSPAFHHQSDDKELEALLDELEQGGIGALFVHGVNPVYDLPGGEKIGELLSKVPLVVSFAERIDETAQMAGFVCPEPHPLSSWGDTEAVTGVVSLSQPTIAPLEDTRTLMESLSAWLGRPSEALNLIQEEWQKKVFPRQTHEKNFESFWNKSLHDGYALVSARARGNTAFDSKAVRNVVPAPLQVERFELVLYPKVTMYDGRNAHNAWLHEVPDPITKVTWDNYAILSPGAADSLSIVSGDVIRLMVDDSDGRGVLELPVWIQPGQPDSVVAVALGYGRKGTERFTKIGPQWIEGKPSVGPNGLVGVNAAPLLRLENGQLLYERQSAQIEKTGAHRTLACTQTYQSVDGPPLLSKGTAERRPLIQFATLAAYAANPSTGSPLAHQSQSMWPEQHEYKGAHWGMMVDLNACTGCSACVVSCQAENNIPVVGKDEVVRNREMHWIRIDRYFMENDGNLDVAHQPMMCQHCDNAPCETVCPVLATVHSEEGLNQQVYNRCVGTRYCSNNCPYKIRRFNWFEYAHDDTKQNMVLNPDVTVRSRGIMEKCSMCVQRIQEQKIEAKRNGIQVADGNIKTACQQSCPAQAIIFGDMNDTASRVKSKINDPRSYNVLAELETRPSVGYMTMVRNRPEQPGETSHG